MTFIKGSHPYRPTRILWVVQQMQEQRASISHDLPGVSKMPAQLAYERFRKELNRPLIKEMSLHR